PAVATAGARRAPSAAFNWPVAARRSRHALGNSRHARPPRLAGQTNKGCGMRKSGGTGWLRRGVLLALTTSTIMVAGCGGGGGGAEATPPDSSPSGAPGSGSGDGAGNRAPTISAAPAAQVSVGAAYDLSPVAADPDGDPLAFSIENKPEWASFDTTSGRLSGTPSAEHVGAYAN